MKQGAEGISGQSPQWGAEGARRRRSRGHPPAGASRTTSPKLSGQRTEERSALARARLSFLLLRHAPEHPERRAGSEGAAKQQAARKKEERSEALFDAINDALAAIDDFIWGRPSWRSSCSAASCSPCACAGCSSSAATPRALRYMVKNEKERHRARSPASARCAPRFRPPSAPATSPARPRPSSRAARAPCSGWWPGSAVRHGHQRSPRACWPAKYRSIDKKTGHVLGGPFYQHRARHGQELALACEGIRLLRHVRGPVRHRNVHTGELHLERHHGLLRPEQGRHGEHSGHRLLHRHHRGQPAACHPGGPARHRRAEAHREGVRARHPRPDVAAVRRASPPRSSSATSTSCRARS